MRTHVEHCASCRAFQADAKAFATALRTTPHEPLGRPPAFPSGGKIVFHSHNGRAGEETYRLRLVTTPAEARSTVQRTEQQPYELRLGFGELALIYESLQATKTLGAVPELDELLDDTIQLVDQALRRAI